MSAPLPTGASQSCQIGLLEPSFRNLASFEFGWPKKCIWPFSGLFVALLGFSLKFSSGNTGASCQTCEGSFYCWSLLCSNNMAINL